MVSCFQNSKDSSAVPPCQACGRPYVGTPPTKGRGRGANSPAGTGTPGRRGKSATPKSKGKARNSSVDEQSNSSMQPLEDGVFRVPSGVPIRPAAPKQISPTTMDQQFLKQIDTINVSNTEFNELTEYYRILITKKK